MSELHTAVVIADADLADDVEIPARLAGSAGLVRLTLAKVRLYLDTALGSRLVPAGGDAGQVLTKATPADFDAQWADSAGGGGGGSLDNVLTPPPLLANWIQQNFGTDTTAEDMVATINASVPGVRMKWAPAANVGNNDTMRMLLRPIPGPHWRVTTRLRFTGVNSSYNVYGICLREAATNKSVTFGWNSNTYSLGREQMSGDNTYNNNFGFGGSQRSDSFRDCWHRISYDGTTFRYYISFDGWSFVEIWNNPGPSVGSIFTTAASHLGFGQNVNDSGAVFLMRRNLECISWVEEVLA